MRTFSGMLNGMWIVLCVGVLLNTDMTFWGRMTVMGLLGFVVADIISNIVNEK